MFAFALPLLLAAAPALDTVAARSGFIETGRYAEVEQLCAAYAKAYPGKVKCIEFGKTPQGRSMKALVASTDGTLEPAALKAKKRPVVLYQGGIHAGEIDGKDAVFWLLEELLDGKVAPHTLDKVTLVFVPVFNIDGHERFGPNNRPNQVGPKEMGWRVTAQNLNLNRDYAKADAPEMQAMLALLEKYDPILYADLHVTDGAKFQTDVSVQIEPRKSGPEAMQALGTALSTSLLEELTKEGHLPVDFYPTFEKDDDPSSGFRFNIAPPRFSMAYWALRHRFGVLVETHSWKDYKTRVQVTHDACLGMLTRAAEHGTEWLAAAAQADKDDAARAGQPVNLAWVSTDEVKTIDFPGYVYTVTDSEVSGARWIHYDDTKPQVWKVPLHPGVKPGLVINAPKVGYLVAPEIAPLVAEKLKIHGLQFTTVKTPIAATLSTFQAEKIDFKPGSYENHLLLNAKGKWSDLPQSLPAGALLVPANQPQLTLVMELLEPTAPDSLLNWGFFNAFFERKEYIEPYVIEPAAREMLKDPAVKAEFDEKLKDPEFKKSKEARLDFFYRKHPAFDARLGIYPVYRVEAPLPGVK